MLKRKDIKMIHKWLREGMSKSAIAKRLGISRETVRKYALKPEGYVPVITRTPNENLVDCIYRSIRTAMSEFNRTLLQ
ncbi:MAG: helix-turn-helix domain-containing protein [Candidatus Paceibacteria bacterium]